MDYRGLMGTHDVVLMTLDTLRYDVAVSLLESGRTPHLGQLLGAGGWEQRHTPGSFTFAAHQAFFAGFLPTPVHDPMAPRPFALSFSGSTTTGPGTAIFDAPHLPAGFAREGYHTVCIGGTGFFNNQNPLGRVLPDLFSERHWSPALGVGEPRSFEHQSAVVLELLPRVESRLFLFWNVSAIHQPNHFYGADGWICEPEGPDSLETHGNALAYVDRHLPEVLRALRRRGPTLLILCADHGTCYGEDGYEGHRLAHPAVWTVPYAEVLL